MLQHQDEQQRKNFIAQRKLAFLLEITINIVNLNVCVESFNNSLVTVTKHSRCSFLAVAGVECDGAGQMISHLLDRRSP